MLKQLKNRIGRILGKSKPKIPPLEPIQKLRAQLPDASDLDIETILRVQPFTMTSPERILALCNAVEYLVKSKIEGSIVECGVWRGGSSAAAAITLRQLNDHSRSLWLYDTYEGMSPPSVDDVDCWGHDADGLLKQQDPKDASSVWCVSSLDEVKQVIASTDYPKDQVHFVEGKVEETIPNAMPEKIALLRLDTDWYESTKWELENLFPRLVPGGVLIIDDYGHWKGCRKAVDEYFAKNSIPMLLNRIDYTGRLGIKLGNPSAATQIPPHAISHVA